MDRLAVRYAKLYRTLGHSSVRNTHIMANPYPADLAFVNDCTDRSPLLNPLPDDKISDWSKWKTLADDKVNVT